MSRKSHRFGDFRRSFAVVLAMSAAALAGCATEPPPATQTPTPVFNEYLIGPGDALQVFVWRNPELTVTVPVRPDGRISVPLVEDMQAAGKSPTTLARDLEKELKRFIQEPLVTVIVAGFVGPYSQQVRVIGEAARPQAIPYRQDMSVLDVMIEVGGLTRFAAGNRAVLVRRTGGKEVQIPVYLDSLLKDGNVSANTPVQPGDVLIVPQTWF